MSLRPDYSGTCVTFSALLSAICHTLLEIAIRFVPHIYSPDVFLGSVNHDAQNNLLGVFLALARCKSMFREVLILPFKIIGGFLAFVDNHSESEDGILPRL
jgi:hypothetical protein